MDTRTRVAGRIVLVGLLALLLTGCSVASPHTTTHSDSHAVSTETTQVLAGNRPVCTGLIVLGSCNVTASTVEADAPVAAPPAGRLHWMVYLLVGATVVFWIAVAWGLSWFLWEAEQD